MAQLQFCCRSIWNRRKDISLSNQWTCFFSLVKASSFLLEKSRNSHVLKMLLFFDHKFVKSNPEGLTEFRFLQRIRNSSSFPRVTFFQECLQQVVLWLLLDMLMIMVVKGVSWTFCAHRKSLFWFLRLHSLGLPHR